MSTLFGRKVQVAVGQRGQAASIVVQDLRIVFKIEKSLEKTPNNSTVDIYNLSPQSRSYFEQDKAAIVVTAGYGLGAKDIFIGDIATAVTKRVGPDIVTSIEAGDALFNYQTKEADVSFAPGASVGSVISKLVSSFGLTSGEMQGVDTNATFLNGLSLSGKIHNHLDTVLGGQQNLEWSIQDGAVQILPNTSASTKPAILLTPKTGLIGSPFKRVVLMLDIAKKQNGEDAKTGIQIKSLLQPEISPGRLLQVQAQFVSGNFKAEKVTHTGDTFATTFYTDVEAIAI